jgi:hypothetical protein
MGLDQYAYIASKQGARDEWYEGAELNNLTNEFENPNMSRPQEIAYWRKHPNLQGWMEMLYEQRGGTETFNGVELELTWEDIDRLEKDIKAGSVAELGTTGFFFGDPSDEYYKEKDLQFCIDAKVELFLGRKVFYNSSW